MARPPERTGALLTATPVLSIGKGLFPATLMVYLLEIAKLSFGPPLVGPMVTVMPVAGWRLLIGVLGVGRFITRFIHPPAGIRPERPVPQICQPIAGPVL